MYPLEPTQLQSEREPAHAQTKHQDNSISGRGARASYRTISPKILARGSLLWAKVHIPSVTDRQGRRDKSAPRPYETDSISFQWPKNRKAKAFATLKILRTCRVTAGWPDFVNLSLISYLSLICEVKTDPFWEWKNFSFRAFLDQLLLRVFTSLRFTSLPLPAILPPSC